MSQGYAFQRKLPIQGEGISRCWEETDIPTYYLQYALGLRLADLPTSFRVHGTTKNNPRNKSKGWIPSSLSAD
ncbi:unnamed protein product [Fusarium graminearum]|uniref:Uncharacterized protein n=1 Tax=Gibberella zeae TaxID=5518 RepID=A0A4E9E5J8_GIBZA|nr:unnamed protein product [Fusarium graminearum]CAF3508332.1 unnamed protein product [Fusarium graminearum]CAG1988675.1 unnamed protein product [Fusarium graminearum]CAG1996648.1 unnamed protein product [Fusarium graminearum]